MRNPLLIPTRFTPPRLPSQTVARSRLLGALRLQSSAKLILIAAGAGFGKTTLVSQWCHSLEADGIDVAWLTLGRGESALSTFMSYLVEAIRRSGVAVQRVGSPSPHGNEAVEARELLAVLVNCFAEHPRNVCIVLDDIQNLTDPPTLIALCDLVAQATDNVRFVFAGRRMPTMSLTRLLIAGQLLQFTAEDLAFDELEADEFLNSRATRRLPESEVQQARRLLGGWPAGLQLLVFALQRQKRWDQVVDLIRGETGFRDYIHENIISGLDPEQVMFLERIATVPRFCASLAIAVTEVAKSAELIRELERRHMFMSKFGVDGPDTWYQLHPLFADALKALLSDRPAEVSECHARAAKWFAENGFMLEAVSQAKAAGGAAAALDWLDGVPLRLRNLGQMRTVRQVADSIDPRSLAPGSPLLPLAAWSYLLSAQLRPAMQWTDCIEASGSGERAITRRALEAGVALYQDDTERMRELIGQIDPATIEQPFLRQCVATERISVELGAGNISSASALQASFGHLMRHERHEMALIVHALKIAGLLAEGNVEGAERHGSKVLRDAEALAGAHSVSAAIAAGFLAEAQYELNRLDEARSTLAGRWHMLYYSPPDPRVRGILTQARLTGVSGGATAAATFIAEALPRFESGGSDRALALILHEQIRVLLSAGRAPQTEAPATLLDRLAERNQGAGGFLAEIGLHADLARARLSIDAGEFDRCSRQLSSARKSAESLNRIREQISILMLEARLKARRSDVSGAEEAIARAIEQVRRTGYWRTLIDESAPIAELVLKSAEPLGLSDSARAALSGLIEARGPTPGIETGSGRDTSPIGGLTPRELEIVRLLCQAMSNKRIAAALSIAPSTVKWNLENIYMKLGLTTRFDVIRWYRRHEA